MLIEPVELPHYRNKEPEPRFWRHDQPPGGPLRHIPDTTSRRSPERVPSLLWPWLGKPMNG
jgi:hypothetical protein